LQLIAQLRYLRIRALDGLVLQQRALHQQVGCIRLLRYGPGDGCFSLRIFLYASDLPELIKKILQGLAFLWSHGSLFL
jgi:hypothetical protein